MSFFFNNFESFGLDIGDRSLKVAFVRKQGRRPALLSFGSLSVPAGLIESGVIKDKKGLADLIKKLVKSARGKKIHTPYVNICLPETKTFIKLITVKAITKEDLGKAVLAELPNHIPIKAEEIACDWQAVEEYADNIKVLVGAVPKKIAQDYCELAAVAGLKPMSLQIEAEAILRAVLPHKKLANVSLAALDLGAARSGFILYANGAIQFTVSLPTAGEDMTSLIASKLKLSVAEAEKAKQLCGLDPSRCNGEIAKILAGTVNELADGVKRNLDFYQEHFSGAVTIKDIALCGGGANLKNLKTALAEKIPGLTVHYGNPLLHFIKKSAGSAGSEKTALDFLHPHPMQKADKKNPLLSPEEAATAATAIGLALTNA